MECLRNKGVLWVLAALLLFVIFSAARSGAADLLSGYARNEMGAWPSAAIPPDAVDHVSSALAVARFIAPGNPDHYEDLARLALVRSAMPEVNGAEKQARLKEGLVQIRKAIALRPVSSYSWATLLLLKRELAEYDAEFRHGLERAVTLGPWEPAVQPIVADAGLSAWSALPAAEQEMVRENFVRGMKRQAGAMIAIVRSHGCGGKSDAGCAR